MELKLCSARRNQRRALVSLKREKENKLDYVSTSATSFLGNRCVTKGMGVDPAIIKVFICESPFLLLIHFVRHSTVTSELIQSEMNSYPMSIGMHKADDFCRFLEFRAQKTAIEFHHQFLLQFSQFRPLNHKKDCYYTIYRYQNT